MLGGETDGKVMDDNEVEAKFATVANGRRVGTGLGGIVDTIIIRSAATAKQSQFNCQLVENVEIASIHSIQGQLFVSFSSLSSKSAGRGCSKIPFYKLRPH